MKGSDKPKWNRPMANEIGRLFQGIIDNQVENELFFIWKHELPQYSNVDYCRIVCGIIPQNKENHRVSITVDINKITYGGLVSTPT